MSRSGCADLGPPASCSATSATLRYTRHLARRQIHTEIEIDVPLERVWGVLSDWPRYGEWSRWVGSIAGELRLGAHLDVQLNVGRRPLGIQPRLIRVDEGRGFCWVGHMLIRGIFDGEHAFDLESIAADRTRFVHSEQCSGVLCGVTLALMRKQIEAGFSAFNRSLKARCEDLPS